MAVWVYGYNALDHLRSVRHNGVVIARYGYDVQGRRIAKRVYSSATGGTAAYTRFLYHGDHVAFETDSTGSIGLRYTWGAGTDNLVGLRDAGGNQYYTVQDKLGSVRGLVKRDGNWVLSLTYRPWGRVLDSAGTQHSLLRYRWTGREFDAETGLYFHRTRYYSPAARRFVQEDAIGYSGGSNLYAYVDGAALEATDPNGLMATYLRGGGGAGLGFPEKNDLGLGLGIGSASNIYLDGVPVPGHSLILGNAAISSITYGGLSQWDILTQVEKNYTGNIAFETSGARATYLSLKKRAYETGSVVLQEALNQAARSATITMSTLGTQSGVCAVACTIPGDRKIIITSAVVTVGLRSEVALAHELGHLLPRPIGVIPRAIPGVGSAHSEYLAFYYENAAREMYGCGPRSNTHTIVAPLC